MGRLRARIRNLERGTAADVLEVTHPDGSTSRFHLDAVMECFLHESGVSYGSCCEPQSRLTMHM